METPAGPTWTDVVSALANAAIALGGIVAAWMGLSTWKAQLRGTLQHDVARRCLLSALKVRDAIQGFRGPFVSSEEMYSALKKGGVDPDKLERLQYLKIATAYVYAERWKPVAEGYTALRADLLEAEAVLGPEWRSMGEPIELLLRRLRVAWLQKSQAEEGVVSAVLYDHSEPTKLDPFATEVEGAVHRIEEQVRPHLGRKRAARRTRAVSDDLQTVRQVEP